MPKKLERQLFAEAKKKRLGKKRTNAYVYGTLFKFKRSSSKKRKK